MSDLSLYIHVPFCRSKCGYCSFVSFTGRERDIPTYIEAVSQEIRLTRRSGTVVKTAYLGGGTPSLLAVEDIRKILDVIHDCYAFDPYAEITLEANPGTVNDPYLKSVHALGINRLSLGVQSLADTELAFLSRCHNSAQARQSIIEARDAGFSNLSLDFIYGLPGRCLSNWETMLGEIVELGADHLSLYGLTVEPDTVLGAAVASGQTPAPDADEAAGEYEMASTALEAAGYYHYEISNWAKRGFESRHNAVYWRRGEYLGFGVAAHSFIEGRRVANTTNLDGYLNSLASGVLPPREIENIGDDAALSEAIFLGLRLDEGISMDDIGRHFNIDLNRRYVSEMVELSGLGLVETSGGKLRLTPKGRLLSNEVFIRFLPQ